MTQAVGEAPAVPCRTCGAPLPVDPTHHWVWCLACHGWSPIPPDVRMRAVHYLARLHEARQLEQQHYQYAHVEQTVAASKRSSARWVQIILGVWVLFGLLGMVPSALFYVVSFGHTLYSEFELWSLVVAGLFAGVLGAIGFGVLVALGYSFWRRRKRHRRETRGPVGGDPQESWAMAICSVCGGHVGFRVGQTSVTCTHCREVVVPAMGHKQQLVALALDRVQLAELERARHVRQRIKAEAKQKRSQQLLYAYAVGGSLFCVAVPFALGFYVLRTFTRSIEQAMEDLADEIQGDFCGGIDPIFEWLDDFWAGDAPPGLLDLGSGFFQSRWSVHATYHGRPILLVAVTDATDRTAKRVYVLLARPTTRRKEVKEAAALSPVAQRARSRGFIATVWDAGVVIQGQGITPALIDLRTFGELADIAEELSESSARTGKTQVFRAVPTP